jgi:hypothetical protein
MPLNIKSFWNGVPGEKAILGSRRVTLRGITSSFCHAAETVWRPDGQ